MPDTFLSLITRYAVNRTKNTRQDMLDWFAEHPDHCINYILRTALPAKYCYDGLRDTCSRIEDDQKLQITCTFYYLTDDGGELTAALRFEAETANEKICFRYSIVPVSAYRTYDKMWAELLLHVGDNPSNFEWPEWVHGVISPD